ncbi:hypothetical protein LTR78_002004 [Recurvomyces mirabilis]|uniref:Uncharacterized protein n=1 Tax=Recurvomyces mirabilis TaxID=574656 RepID=A0AAE0WTJ6_9PEZI|nr:hypothetical protein LTR78_002004 [Recurvomyces mirabilis]KAK5160462.1 hypothetical protein LTS14_001474 [Recurvomyces mirabilis]
MSGKKTGNTMGDWFRNILSCCDKQEEEEEERPALQISGPIDFRREDISIPGLDPEQQRWIREKAITDAGRMWDHLQPLRSSPSGQFADPKNTATLPTYEEFTTPRSAPSPTATSPTHTQSRRTSVSSNALERVRAHARKVSNTLTKPLGGYQSVASKDSKESGSPYEMRALMDPSRTQVVSPGKMSVEVGFCYGE